MAEFKIGQRWISETEPELGLGILESVERLQIRLVFPASNEARIYSTSNAPIIERFNSIGVLAATAKRPSKFNPIDTTADKQIKSI